MLAKSMFRRLRLRRNKQKANAKAKAKKQKSSAAADTTAVTAAAAVETETEPLEWIGRMGSQMIVIKPTSDALRVQTERTVASSSISSISSSIRSRSSTCAPESPPGILETQRTGTAPGGTTGSTTGTMASSFESLASLDDGASSSGACSSCSHARTAPMTHHNKSAAASAAADQTVCIKGSSCSTSAFKSSSTSPTSRSSTSRSSSSSNASTTSVSPTDWGFPDHLSPSETSILVQFQQFVRTRPQSHRDAIFSFGPQESEDYALCRWLRARKFVLDDTIEMVEQAVRERVEPSKHNFYPDASEALGVEEAIYKTQYPQVFSGGISKDGKPLFFSKPGLVNIHGLQSTSTPDGVNRYQWHCMQHAFSSVIQRRAQDDPTFTRYQSCVIMDLEHLCRSTINSKVLDIVRHQSRVDALCYPEILGTCIIVNAPTFFSAVWSIVRRWLDPRTAGKIEIYSFKGSAERRLRELIDEEHLPREYGGRAPSVAEIIVAQGTVDGTKVSRRVTKLMHVKNHSSFTVDVEKDEEMEIVVYTRSIGGALFKVDRLDGHNHPHHHHHGKHHHAGKELTVEHIVQCPAERADENAAPYSDVVAQCLRGPAQFKIRGEAHKSRLSAADHFLVVCNIFEAGKNRPMSRLPSDTEHYVYEAF